MAKPSVETIQLWRPVGPRELELIIALDMKAFPPRLPEQPIFYPVLNEGYATKITREWNVPAFGVGHVTRFLVRKDFLHRYEVQQVGGREHVEYWIPSEDMDKFNAALVGKIEIAATYHS